MRLRGSQCRVYFPGTCDKTKDRQNPGNTHIMKSEGGPTLGPINILFSILLNKTGTSKFGAKSKAQTAQRAEKNGAVRTNINPLENLTGLKILKKGFIWAS